ILTEKIARRGYDLVEEYQVDPLERLHVRELMTRDVLSIPGAMPIREVLQKYFTGPHGHLAFPVLDGQGRLLGMLAARDVLELRPEDLERSIVAADLVARHPQVAFPEETCRVAAERMALHDVGRLPVVEAGHPFQLVGIITRSDLLKPRVTEFLEEHRVERILGPKPGAAP
ncbi:MAG TPA: CBS domain-containing protein, partial [bacterium]|nr:CBS domain-containing protein [bacterium]